MVKAQAEGCAANHTGARGKHSRVILRFARDARCGSQAGGPDLRWAFTLILSLACIVVSEPRGHAQSDGRTSVGHSLVYLEVSGQRPNGQPLGGSGTGFFVSKDGQILTSYHLLDKVSEAIPESVTIKVFIGGKEGQQRTANVVDAKPNSDLLLLKIRSGLKENVPVKLGSAWRLSAQHTTVYTSGFFADGNDIGYQDEITSFNGPGGSTWMLKTQVDEGQSGSPVYLDDGTVIGVLKGELGSHRGVFVPIELAETMLLPLRLHDLQERLDKLAALGPDVAFLKLMKDPAGRYVPDDNSTEALNNWLSGYIAGAGSKVLDDKVWAALEKPELESKLEKAQHNMVAYSYSDEFILTYDHPDHKMPFIKTALDHGKVYCHATYPLHVRNQIYYSFNDQENDDARSLRPKQGAVTVDRPIPINYDSGELWRPDTAKAVKDAGEEFKEANSINFVLNQADTPAAQAQTTSANISVRLQCMILMVGAARLKRGMPADPPS
jgi:Trypsin-like peptidase domain